MVASFLVRDMGLDWRLGAEHFEAHLLDHDPCSNWGNWQYCAGEPLTLNLTLYISFPPHATHINWQHCAGERAGY